MRGRGESMNRSELSLLGRGLSALTTWTKKTQKIGQDKQKIEKIEKEIEKIEARAAAEREKAKAKITIRLLKIEELKLKRGK